jgi:hypothetical protein
LQHQNQTSIHFYTIFDLPHGLFCRYIDRKDFQYGEMDTDSAYMALSGELFDIIKPTLRQEFFFNLHKWLPRTACDHHHSQFLQAMISGDGIWEMKECCQKINKYNQRTPGLFKEEFVSDGIISLNSKTYFCWTDDKSIEESKQTKYHGKYLSRTQNELTKQQFF